MKYTTTMSRVDMIDHINELEARLNFNSIVEDNGLGGKTYKTLEDFILDKVDKESVDLSQDIDEDICDMYDMDEDIDECLLNDELDAAVHTILRQYSDEKIPLASKNIAAFVDLICALEAGPENES